MIDPAEQEARLLAAANMRIIDHPDKTCSLKSNTTGFYRCIPSPRNPNGWSGLPTAAHFRSHSDALDVAVAYMAKPRDTAHTIAMYALTPCIDYMPIYTTSQPKAHKPHTSQEHIHAKR